MKERLDVILVNKGLCESRDKAKRTIMAGLVTVDGNLEDKPGRTFDVDSEFVVKEKLCPYVSRGGLKLEKAIEEFNISAEGAVCVDMGASTGGFTDCMLQNGAVKVYAIDVGYGQLDYKLRVDPRVVNMEKTNIRYLDTNLIEEPVNLISIDVSFISVKHMLPVAAKILAPDGAVLCLVKPQFEAGREQVGKKGIVRDHKVHVEVIEKVIGYGKDNGLTPIGLTYSPVKGTKGNIEYLCCFVPDNAVEGEIFLNPKEVVELSHSSLDE
ncbi:MAG: TlyA family RNA methyltransferase [Clostridiales bacterium]|nr:TlyA family RNA methyltransferase [Candidatus Crickella merdequi]